MRDCEHVFIDPKLGMSILLSWLRNILDLDILFSILRTILYTVYHYILLWTVLLYRNCNLYGISCWHYTDFLNIVLLTPIGILYTFSVTRIVTLLFYIVSFQLNGCLASVLYHVRRVLCQKNLWSKCIHTHARMSRTFNMYVQTLRLASNHPSARMFHYKTWAITKSKITIDFSSLISKLRVTCYSDNTFWLLMLFVQFSRHDNRLTRWSIYFLIRFITHDI